MLSHFLSKNLSWKHMFRSVFSAFIGIQKTDQATQDFAHGNLYAYIVVGIVCVLVFILTVWTVVRWVL